MEVRASIDIGSNSILLLVCEFENNRILKTLANESHVTGLGRELDLNKAFSEVAMKESFEVFREYQKICSKLNVNTTKVIVTATEAARVAENSQVFFERIKNECGFNVKIITGEGEAFYSTVGILSDDKIKDSVITVMDIGGASTELIKVDTEKKKILKSFSMPIGAVRMNNWIENNIAENKLNEVFSNFSQNIKDVETNKLFCVAGTMTSVGNIYLNHSDFMENEINGLEFSKESMDILVSKYADYSSDDMLKRFPFLGKRSKTIISGMKMAQNIMNHVGNKEIYISTYGLRYGTLMEGDIRDEFIVK